MSWITSISILLLSAASVGTTISLGWTNRRVRRVEDEVTELHAYIDAERMNRGLPPMFARSYGLDIEDLPPPPDHL